MDKDLESGIYNLIIYLAKNKEIEVGSLGEFKFKSGYYIYTGTAQRNLQARINRHRKEDKRLHWHIDYLLQYGEIKEVKTWAEEQEFECRLHNKLAQYLGLEEPISGFGASDCSCNSHLLYSCQLPKIRKFHN